MLRWLTLLLRFAATIVRSCRNFLLENSLSAELWNGFLQCLQNLVTVLPRKDRPAFPLDQRPENPPDNNRPERELRPLVIARKISFGSQSAAGACTREVLMTCCNPCVNAPTI